jgi:predicted nucleotidyltransferase
MSYQISSDRFTNPLLKELLEVLANYFRRISTEFYIIGATARDIVLGGIHHRNPHRRTLDLDIAIMIPDWNSFEQIATDLCAMADFKKDNRQKQRFSFKDIFELDIVPFGEIAQSNKTILWPPEATVAMSVIGFTEMAKRALSVTIDKKFTVLVASLPGIFVLKISAWRDRHLSNTKDAEDIALLIDEYLEINTTRAIEEHADIYEKEIFTTFIAGATLMARDVKAMLTDKDDVSAEVITIIEKEVIKEEGSKLIDQILYTNSSKSYEEVYQALTQITEELRK